MLFLLLILILIALSWAVSGRCISAVSVSPASPTNAALLTIVVEGHAPAMNYRLTGTGLRRLGNALVLDMYWRGTGYGGIALAPYRHRESVGPLPAGRYDVTVRSICDGLSREVEAISFTVSSPVGVPPVIWPDLPWHFLPSHGTDNSRSLVQVQSLVPGDEPIFSDPSFDSDGTGRQGPRREKRVG